MGGNKTPQRSILLGENPPLLHRKPVEGERGTNVREEGRKIFARKGEDKRGFGRVGKSKINKGLMVEGGQSRRRTKKREKKGVQGTDFQNGTRKKKPLGRWKKL